MNEKRIQDPVSWHFYSEQESALKALTRASIESPKKRLFAFQTDTGMVYVLEEPNVVGRVVLGKLKAVGEENQPFRWAEHCFEYFDNHEDTPMILYADCGYPVLLNKELDPAKVLMSLIWFVHSVIAELLIANGVDNPRERAGRLIINVETSHGPEKVSFRLKIPQIIVANMQEQHAFWQRVLQLIEQHQYYGDPSALQLLVSKEAKKQGEVEQVKEPFLNMNTYKKTQGRFLRTLGAAKNGSLSFLVPQGASDRSSITLRQWLSSLVLRPFAKEGVSVPQAWYLCDKGQESKKFADEGIVVSQLQTTSSSKLIQEIDFQWMADSAGIKITHSVFVSRQEIEQDSSSPTWSHSFAATSSSDASEAEAIANLSSGPATSHKKRITIRAKDYTVVMTILIAR